MALSAGAGATNVVAFLACARFVTHVTGTATLIGLDASDLAHAFDYSLVLGLFVLGAYSSEFVLANRLIHRGVSRALFIVAAVLTVTAVLGQQHWFDDFGEPLEDPQMFFFLGPLAFAMGLQNAAVTTATGGRVRTTHMTGPATDLGVALARMRSRSFKERYAARQLVILRSIKLSGFIVGAAVGALASRMQYLALLLPAAICVGTALFLQRFPGASAPKTLPPSTNATGPRQTAD